MFVIQLDEYFWKTYFQFNAFTYSFYRFVLFLFGLVFQLQNLFIIDA